MKHGALRVALLGIVLFTLSQLCHAASWAPSREPLDLVPADSLLCWVGRPLDEGRAAPSPGDAAAATQPSTLQLLWELATRITSSPLERGTQLDVRLTELLGLIVQYPHAVALIDARARPTESDPNSPRVDQLRVALVVQNDGRLDPFLRIIQRAVDEQTNSGQATLTNTKIGGWVCQELRDRRLPEWAVIAWGQLDRHFVLTIGTDVWPLVAAVAVGQRPAFSQETWFRGVRVAPENAGETAQSRPWRPGTAPRLEIFVAATALRERLDPFVSGHATEFFRAWDAADVERAYWAIGFERRALYCRAYLQIEGRTAVRVYADPENRDPRLLAAVPADTPYALCTVPMQRFLPRLVRGLLITQGDKPRANIARRWANIQAERGFEAERDILAHLGDRVIVHNFPPHPLRIPFALTLAFEIRDEPATVRRAIEAASAGWQAVLSGAGGDGQSAASAPSGSPQSAPQRSADRKPGAPFTIEHDDEGLWYLRFGVSGSDWLGLAGPAWTVTDRFIILSWSPLALREYLDQVPEDVKHRSK